MIEQKGNKELLACLPPKVQKEFMENVRKFNPAAFNNILEGRTHDLSGLIGGAFCWTLTPQGNDYWYIISRSNIDKTNIL